MPGSLRESVSESLGAFRAVFSNRDLRLLQFAATAAETGKWLYIVALSVYAYDMAARPPSAWSR